MSAYGLKVTHINKQGTEMQPSDYTEQFDAEVWNMNDDLIDLIGDREAVIGYEFEEGDKQWGERDSFTVSLFARFPGDEKYECLDHLLSEEDQNEIEVMAREHMDKQIADWNQP